MNPSEIMGSIGVSILLLAYLFNILKWVKTDGAVYPLMNFTGAAIACYSSWMISFFPFVILEGTWALLSLVTLIKWMWGARFKQAAQ